MDINDLNELQRLWKSGKLKKIKLSEQALIYEDIIDACTDGYTDSVVSPRGEVVHIVKKDYPTALKALKQYSDLVKDAVYIDAGNDNTSVNIIVSEAVPKFLEKGVDL